MTDLADLLIKALQALQVLQVLHIKDPVDLLLIKDLMDLLSKGRVDLLIKDLVDLLSKGRVDLLTKDLVDLVDLLTKDLADLADPPASTWTVTASLLIFQQPVYPMTAGPSAAPPRNNLGGVRWKNEGDDFLSAAGSEDDADCVTCVSLSRNPMRCSSGSFSLQNSSRVSGKFGLLFHIRDSLA